MNMRRLTMVALAIAANLFAYHPALATEGSEFLCAYAKDLARVTNEGRDPGRGRVNVDCEAEFISTVYQVPHADRSSQDAILEKLNSVRPRFCQSSPQPYFLRDGWTVEWVYQFTDGTQVIYTMCGRGAGQVREVE
jgi:hypothetical protein